jgi:hypothetical protein
MVGRADLPLLAVSRPALALVDQVGYDEPSVSTGTFQKIAEKPRTTVTRYLKQLTQTRLILRVRQREYAIPSRSTFSRLLLEPSRYRRSVLLYADVLEQRGEVPWAFACLPIRSSYPMDIDQAIPVLHSDERLKDTSRSRPYPEALWYTFDSEETHAYSLEADEPGSAIEMPVLPAELSLALSMASLDPRHMQAARDAAQKLEPPLEEIAPMAKQLAPARPPLEAIRPNTVVFPQWLEDLWETAKTQHARHALDEFLPEKETQTLETR